MRCLRNRASEWECCERDKEARFWEARNHAEYVPGGQGGDCEDICVLGRYVMGSNCIFVRKKLST